MQNIIRYLSHPQVEIDPHKDIPQWSLNSVGMARVNALAGSDVLGRTTRVISSAETKAVETAQPLASTLGCDVEVRSEMHENDRSATGFLPPDEFEKVADQFFAFPDKSIRGWETAFDAQDRIFNEVTLCLNDKVDGDILFVGHGGVGTLLFCKLMGVPISRKYDQIGGGGCYFAFCANERKPLSNWLPMEEMT